MSTNLNDAIERLVKWTIIMASLSGMNVVFLFLLSWWLMS